MNIPSDLILKFLIFGGALAFVLLLVNFQFVFAVIVLIISIVSFIFFNQTQQG